MPTYVYSRCIECNTIDFCECWTTYRHESDGEQARKNDPYILKVCSECASILLQKQKDNNNESFSYFDKKKITYKEINNYYHLRNELTRLREQISIIDQQYTNLNNSDEIIQDVIEHDKPNILSQFFFHFGFTNFLRFVDNENDSKTKIN